MLKSNIQWTESTHNFWSGCTKVSDGCKFCYMHRIKEGKGEDGSNVTRASDKYFYAPYFDREPKLIFTCSMSDFFIEQADAWRERAWATIKNTPWHTWQILTKRPERIKECLPADWGEGYPNVWLGVTVENEKTLNRIEQLLSIPAKLYFVSMEPLLGEISFVQNGNNLLENIDWIIIGGESGNDYGKYVYRPCEIRWIKKIVADARLSNRTKVFIKQMGTHLAKAGIGTLSDSNGNPFSRHGDNYQFFPESLKIREMPASIAV